MKCSKWRVISAIWLQDATRAEPNVSAGHGLHLDSSVLNFWETIVCKEIWC